MIYSFIRYPMDRRWRWCLRTLIEVRVRATTLVSPARLLGAVSLSILRFLSFFFVFFMQRLSTSSAFWRLG